MAAGLSSLLNTARDALGAQAYGVTVTGQNITNVNTDGYTRREALLETRALGAESYGGVHVAGLRQIQDAYLDRAQLISLGQKSSADYRDRALAGVESLFNDGAGTGLGNQLDALFKSFGSLATRPDDLTARSAVLGAAELFSSSVRNIADELASTREKLLSNAKQIVEQVNTRAREVSELNRQIHNAEIQGKDAADLKDQRSQVLLDLGQLIDVRTTIDGGGNVLVHSAGVALVEGGNARTLSVELDGDGQIALFAGNAEGTAKSEVTRFLTGGALAGVKEARDVDVFEVAKRLDEFVFEVGNAINAQHGAGVGLDGLGGRNVFDVPGASEGAARVFRLSEDVAGDPQALAAAAPGTLPGGADNAVALAGLGDLELGITGRTTFDNYGALVGDVASRKAAAARNAEMRDALHAQTEAMRESLSGVSLDEEMVTLSKYQRAYEAAAKVLSTVDELLGELISRVGR